MSNTEENTAGINQALTEVGFLQERVSNLEAKVESLIHQVDTQKLNQINAQNPVKSISSYKNGDIVEVLVGFESDFIRGRVIEHTMGKGAVIVGTSKGEVTIGDPNRIRKA